jgi:hypothetical protein
MKKGLFLDMILPAEIAVSDLGVKVHKNTSPNLWNWVLSSRERGLGAGRDRVMFVLGSGGEHVKYVSNTWRSSAI